MVPATRRWWRVACSALAPWAVTTWTAVSVSSLSAVRDKTMKTSTGSLPEAVIRNCGLSPHMGVPYALPVPLAKPSSRRMTAWASRISRASSTACPCSPAERAPSCAASTCSGFLSLRAERSSASARRRCAVPRAVRTRSLSSPTRCALRSAAWISMRVLLPSIARESCSCASRRATSARAAVTNAGSASTSCASSSASSRSSARWFIISARALRRSWRVRSTRLLIKYFCALITSTVWSCPASAAWWSRVSIRASFPAATAAARWSSSLSQMRSRTRSLPSGRNASSALTTAVTITTPEAAARARDGTRKMEGTRPPSTGSSF
mmetsp:Transcript_69168/g.218806  ORF Transcript_69168/g.218806 Transcript_69168/m.218806 type:complete len:324 (-) Transcript_69168:1900-2871(-)